jgi:hypothetical protein
LLWNLALLFFCYHYQLWFHELLKLFTCTFWPAYGNDTLEELVEDSSASMPWLQYGGGSLCSNRCMPKLLVTVVCNRVAPLWRQMPSFIDGFRMMARWKKLWVDDTFSFFCIYMCAHNQLLTCTYKYVGWLCLAHGNCRGVLSSIN